MKFGKVFAAQMVLEWQEAYMNYGNLKKILKEIQRMKERKRQAAKPVGLERAALYRAFSGLIQRQNHPTSASKEAADIESQIILVNSVSEDGSENLETTFLKLAEEGGEWEQEFFRRLDDEFNKVGKFYRSKVQEVMAEAQTLSKQMDALIAFRIKANKLQGLLDSSPLDLGASNRIRPIDVIQTEQRSQRQSDDETSEKHMNNRKNQEHRCRGFKQAPVEILDHVKLNKTLDTPSDIIKGCINDPDQTEVIINRENLKKVEGQLKQAFVEFYRKIGHLKGYSFMNVLAFSKIMKKYDKITSRKASVSYMKMVDKSYLGSSDDLAMANPPGSSTTQYKIIQHKHDTSTNIEIRWVTKLMERVEAAFIKHFLNSNRSKGMQMLRPKAKRERHRISFSLGFFVGCSLALIVALIFLVHACDLLDEEGKTQYMENMFPLYSFFAFVVLHMLMYASNIYFWRRYRVNYPFIFGFKQGTELGYREVLLVSCGLAVLALSSVLLNLDLEMDPEANDYKALTELLPLGLLLLVIVILVFPFNIIYRSSRFFFSTCMFHCICAPLYKVTLQDFFLAEQLTSEVQAFRSLEFYICHYGWGEYKLRQNSCKTSHVYSTFYFIVAVIPYTSRFLQCLRRLYEERDPMHVFDGLKYFLTMAAISTGTAYGLYMEKRWKIVFGIFAAIATISGTYWDLCVDWGLLQRQSKNRWLRDKLLLPSKTVYFAAMVLNILLRFAWLQTVLDLQFSFLHKESVTAIVASLEIIRRGIWNFFRLENEHLNNVGKYRAFKSLPLPFTYNEDE